MYEGTTTINIRKTSDIREGIKCLLKSIVIRMYSYQMFWRDETFQDAIDDNSFCDCLQIEFDC